MDFKTIKNLKTLSMSYYVDDMKVEQDTYSFMENLCKIKRLVYNSSYSRIRNHCRIQSFSYN